MSEKGVGQVETLLDIDAAEVFYDGLLTDPRLDHPEGLAVHRDGSIWCGGERGQIYRIEPDGSSMEQIASSDGFSQGMAFDAEDNLYVCDLVHAGVMKLDTKSGTLERFATGAEGRGINIANYPVFDAEGSLYVSDSHAFKEPGPGIFRFNPDGSGELWYDEPVDFANGLAFSLEGKVQRLIGDEEAHLFCHPTNLAFRGSTLFTTNLGRWHITAIETAAHGLPLYGGYGN